MQKPKDRLIFFAILPLIIWLLTNIEFMPSLSLYAHLGIPSPSIGLTRAFWELLAGDFAGAWNLNPLIYPVVLVVLSIIVKDLDTVFRKR